MSRDPTSGLAAGQHRYNLRVYYEDTDAGGIVYHANYLRFAERARTEALRALGVPHAELVALFGLIFVVRRVKLDYLLPAGLDDVLTVVSESLKVGQASVILRQSVERSGGPVLAVAEVTLACVRGTGERGTGERGTGERGTGGRGGTMRPARMPARWHQALTSLAAGAGQRE